MTVQRVAIGPTRPTNNVDGTFQTEDSKEVTIVGGIVTEIVFITPLDVTSISPVSGSTAGGDTITATGQGFENDASVSVTVHGNPATGVTVNSNTQMVFDSPAGTAGTGDVVFTVGSETFTLTDGFEYTAPATFNGWDVSSLPSNVTASNNDFTLSRSAGVDGTRIVRHGTTRSAGKYAIRLLVNNGNVNQAPAVGIANAASLGTYLGENAAGWGYWPNDSGTLERGIHNTAVQSFGDQGNFNSPTEVMIEIDIDNGRLWFGADGVWATGNPATDTSPAYTGITGTVELVVDMFYQGDVELLQPADFTTPATAGFTAGWPISATAWTPANITTELWLDADDASTITESSGNVTQWNDKSGNSNHVSQSTSSQQPTTGTTTINGLNAIDFDGSNDFLETASNPFAPSISDAFVIAVYKANSISQGTLFSLTGGTGSGLWQTHAPWSDGNMYFDCGGNAPPNRISASYGLTAGDDVLSSFYCSVTDTVQEVYKNGTVLASDATGHTVSTSGNITICKGASNRYQDASVGEIIIINGTVDTATRELLEGYLAHKWGLEGDLPAMHPYKSSPP